MANNVRLEYKYWVIVCPTDSQLDLSSLPTKCLVPHYRQDGRSQSQSAQAEHLHHAVLRCNSHVIGNSHTIVWQINISSYDITFY